LTGTTFDVADGSADADLLVSGTLVDGPGASWPTPQVSYLTKTGAGTMVLSGANTYSGVTTISAGTLRVGNGGTAGTLGSGRVINNSVLAFNRSDTVSVSALSGTGKLVMSGSGTLNVSGANTFTGGMEANAGTMRLGTGGGSFSSASGNTLTINNGASVYFDTSNLFGNHDTVPANAVVINSGGVLDSGNSCFSHLPALTLNGGTLRSSGTINSYPYALRGGVVVNGGANSSVISATSVGLGSVALTGTTFDVADGSADADLLVSGTLVDGPGASWATPQVSYLTKTGAGTMVLSGANTYSGVTTISAGTLRVGNGGTSGNLGTGSIVNHGTLAFHRSDNRSLGTSVSGTGSLQKLGGNTLTLTANQSFTGSTLIDAGTLQVGNGGTVGSLASSSIVNNAALAYHRSDDITLAAVISGTGTLTKAGAGTLTVAGANTYSGVTTISAGTLRVGNGGTSGSLGSGNVVNNATLAFNRGGDLTVPGAISGTGTLTMAGTGTLIVSGANTYSGVTTISAGTLQVGNGGTSGALGSGAVVNNGALVFHRSDDLSLGSSFSGSGSFRKLGANTLTLTGNHSFSGSTTIEAGTLQVGNGGTSGSLASSAIVNHGTLGHNRSDDVALTATISGTGALTKSGSGTLTLSGANTYSGVTTVSAGTLQVGNGGTTGTTGSGAVVNNGLLILNRSDAITIAGALSGTGGLSKRGAGVASLASGSTLQGDIDVTGGTLVLPASGTVSSPAIRVSAGATLNASTRPAGLSLGSGQTLLNVGGSATLLGSVDASSGGLALSYSAGTPALMVGNGVIVLSSATGLRITNSGPALSRGNYKIISKLPGGSVGGTLPAVAVEGGGIVSGGLAKLAIISGELILTVNAVSLAVSSTQPPDVIFHQGYLTDATGSPLGTPNPKNYDVAFRLYTSATGGSPVWGERQVVTVDGGRFGVHLGDGDPYLGDPSTVLSSVFIANDAALYLETTVRGGGTGGADLVLSPRAILAPNPYAFLSRHARGAGNLVNSSNQSVLSVVGTRVGINNPLPTSALDVAGSVRVTNVIGSGTASVGGTFTAQRFEGRGIVPVGGIIVWSGTTPPGGWALCDGRVAQGRRTPDLRGRFVLGTGAGTGLTARAAGQVGGAETVTLTEAQMPQHRHSVDVPLFMTAAGGGHNHSNKTGAGSGEGLGKDDNQNHWFGAGAYIIQNRSGGGGSHNHFVDIPSFRVGAVGGGKPQNNLPPFYAMAFIMRVE
jgi:autotransporter-associated beta strand protein